MTVVIPSGKKLPDGGFAMGVIAPSTMSVAVNLLEKSTFAPCGLPLAAFCFATVMLAGIAVISGGVVSCTVTLKVTMAYAPELSAAEVQTTVVLPSGNVDPELGAEVTEKLLPAPSDTVGGVKFTVAPPASVASTVISGGWDAVKVVGPTKKFRGVVLVLLSLLAIS